MKGSIQIIILIFLSPFIKVIYEVFLLLRPNKNLHILSSEDTINNILSNRVSISRFGDGEMKIIEKESIGFQPYSEELSRRLEEVLKSNMDGHLVCVLNVLTGDTRLFKNSARAWWHIYLMQKQRKWESILSDTQTYGDSLFTRFYIDIRDKSKCGHTVSNIKKIWENRDVILVEGNESRLGVGNDLFNNANSISRILCPSRDSFSSYNEIFLETCKLAKKSSLVLIALGPTASILAYDLSKEGFQALDIGHIDIEYEWFRRKASYKIPIKGKFTNECGTEGGVIEDDLYESQIIKRIEQRNNK